MRRLCVLLVFSIITGLILSIGITAAQDGGLPSDGEVPGKPLQYLQQQINELKAQLDEIQLLPGPPGEPGEPGPPGEGAIRVYDSSEPPQFVGILVGIYPTGYKASEIYREVTGSFTVYIPDLGKFIELNRTGEVVTSRFRFEYLYYKVDECDDSQGIYAIPHPWDEVVDSAFISAHLFVTDEGLIWSYYMVGALENVWLESNHSATICDNNPGEFSDAYSLTEVTLPFTLPLVPPLSFQ
jgi:hypothetical protein